MSFKLSLLPRLALLLLLIVPATAWLLVKPVRVLAPGLMGLSCPNSRLCVDDPARLAEAERLYTESISFVAEVVFPIEGQPKLIFCSTPACAESFGLGARAAVTVGRFGTVLGPRAWQPHIVRHELIHYLQGERIGVLSLMFKPKWFVEGMAYSLSQDPRAPLNEPFESYREAFEAWYASIDRQLLWKQARKL